MKIKIVDNNISQEQLTQLNNMFDIVEKMIIGFVSDKLGDRISKEKITNILNTTVCYLDNVNLGEGVVAQHEGFSGNIRFGGMVYKARDDSAKLDAISVIIHELQHKFSQSISKGEKSRVLDEGFSDIFADECMNYLLQNNPQELKKIGINNPPLIHISRDDYKGENEFTRMILEVIRQKTGRHYEAEYEYIFGGKDNFLNIVRDAIGEEGVRIIEEQREKEDSNEHLGEQYNYTYNKRLVDLLQNIPLEYIDIDDYSNQTTKFTGDFNVFLYRQGDGLRKIASSQQLEKKMMENGIDVYNMTPEDIEVFKQVYSKLPYGNNSRILQGYLKNCKTANDVEELLEIEGMKSGGYEIRREAIEGLINSTNLDIHNILKVIGKKVISYKEFLKDDVMKKLIDKIDEIEISTSSDAEIDTILKIALKNNIPNETFLKKIEEIEQIKKDEINTSVYKQFEIKLAKIKVDKQPKGQELSEIFQMYFEKGDEIKDDELHRFVWYTVKEYVEKEAKNDIKGFNEIVNKLRTFEERIKQTNHTEGVKEAAALCELTQDTIFNVLLEDIGKVSTHIGIKIQIADLDKMYKREWWTQSFGSIISIPDNNYFNMNSLTRMNGETKLINLFDDRIIEKYLTGRIKYWAGIDNGYSARESTYEQLDIKDRKKCLRVLTRMVDGENEELQNIGDIISLYKEIMRFDVDEDKKTNEEVKQAFHNKITQIISARKDPLNDLQIMYKIKIPKSLEFMYNEVLGNLERKINEQNEFSDKSLQNLIYTAPGDKNIQKLISRVLESHYKGTTTEQFIYELRQEKNRLPYIFSNPENKQKFQAWIETRTMGYLRAIGRADDKTQKQLLLELQEQSFERGRNFKTPQFTQFNDLDGQSQYAIISNIEGEFRVLHKDIEPENDEELINKQNKGKKGLFSIFKRKSDKEIITDTVPIGRKDNLVQVINRYESGKIEVAVIDISKSKIKNIKRTSQELQDIGNNGGMVLDESFIPKVNMQYQEVGAEKNRRESLTKSDEKTTER